MPKLLKFYPTLLAVYSLLPLAAGAQTFEDFVNKFLGAINTVIGVLFAIASVIFLWGVLQFIAKSSDEQGREKAKGIMTWGIVGLAVMASVWGMVNILVTYFFGAGGVESPGFKIPKVPVKQ